MIQEGSYYTESGNIATVTHVTSVDRRRHRPVAIGYVSRRSGHQDPCNWDGLDGSTSIRGDNLKLLSTAYLVPNGKPYGFNVYESPADAIIEACDIGCMIIVKYCGKDVVDARLERVVDQDRCDCQA